MSKSSLELLEQGEYKYIIGARVKNETEDIKQWIFSLEKLDGVFYEHPKDDRRLIVCYSEKRAKKDCYNRLKGVRRLQKAYKNGNITKENINKRGYNKFLDISNDVKVAINPEKSY